MTITQAEQAVESGTPTSDEIFVVGEGEALRLVYADGSAVLLPDPSTLQAPFDEPQPDPDPEG